MAQLNSANTVRLSPEGGYLRREDKADVAGILPCHMVQRTGAELMEVNDTADIKPAVLRVADMNGDDAGEIDRPYTAGENTHYVTPQAGTYITLRVGNSRVIAVEGELTSAGDGTVKPPSVAGVGVSFIADEAITTGAGDTAFIRAIVAHS